MNHTIFFSIFFQMSYNTFPTLRVVSNFGDCDCGAGEIHTHAREISRRRVYFALPTIAIAKIRDYTFAHFATALAFLDEKIVRGSNEDVFYQKRLWVKRSR